MIYRTQFYSFLH